MNKKPWMILSGCLFLSASQAMSCGSPVVNPDPELLAPTLASVTPPKASNAGGVMLTINGANFQPGVSVTIGGVAATMVAVVSANQLTCTIPAKAATCGQVPITVANPDGKSATASDLFSYNPGKAGFAAATTLPTGTTPRQVLATDVNGV